ncbi:MAG: NAD(P)H-dependent oxidoreductase [Deltaproteobacteria bacterium]|nr:MAG: NAD(P)H-dependent oxidoreductase [Deltaproteobacteria bacterium]
MTTLSGNHLIEQLQWRYAVKKFETLKISAQDWKVLEDALILSPSSYGLQPWKFIVVTNSGVKKQLRPVSWGQSQIEDCSQLVVFAARKTMDEAYVQKFINRIVDVRKIDPASIEFYKNMILGDVVKGERNKIAHEWATRQCYIAIGNLMTAAAVLGIDTCPLEGIEPPKYDEILGLKNSEYATVVACAVGYRSAEDKYASAPKVRFEKKDVIQEV